MAKITIGAGVLLILLGIGGYFGTDAKSFTALIPAFVGVPLALLGWLALKDNLRKHAMHAAVMVGLLGFLGAAYRPVKTLVTGGSFENPTATALQTTMAVLCAIFVGLCIKSFIDVRRRRMAESEPNTTT